MIYFYRKTATLWTLTRALLILLLIASMVITYLQVGFYLGSAISFFLLGIYLVLLGITLFRKGNQPSGSSKGGRFPSFPFRRRFPHF